MDVIGLTEKELQTITAAMAGNFPESLSPYRMGALRKLAGARPSTTSGAVEAIREHVDTVMPRDGSLVDMGTVAASCERLWKAVHPDGGGN